MIDRYIIITAFILLGLIGCVVTIFKPRISLKFLIVFSLLIVGPIQFFIPELTYLRWTTQLLGIFLVCLGFILIPVHKPTFVPTSIKFIGLFLLCMIVSVLINGNYTDFVYDTKNYIAFLCIPLLSLTIADDDFPDFIFKFYEILAIVQVPFAVVQYFFFNKVSMHMPGDIVSGTFGGVKQGLGGPNSELSIFMMCYIFFILLRWVYGNAGIVKTTLLVLYSSIPILLSHSKAIVLFIFVSYLVLLPIFFSKKKIQTIAVSIMLFLFLTAVGLYHYNSRWSYTSKEFVAKDFSSYVDQSIGYNLESKNKRELTRLTALSFWFDNHDFSLNPIETLLGHGVGSSKITGVHIGSLVTSGEFKGYTLSITSCPKLLWEIGMVGTFCFIFIFVSTFIASIKVARRTSNTDLKCFSYICMLFSVISIIMLFYRNSFFSTQAFSALTMVHIGFVTSQSAWKPSKEYESNV